MPKEGPHLTGHEHAVPMDEGPTGPLRGLRVIDVTTAIAGPYCSMLLSDLGADVIKVEPPGGEGTRRAGPWTLDDDVKAYAGGYAIYNRNKRSIALDLTKADDCDILLRLVDTADALIENTKAGVFDRFGLSYETLHERNPRLVYTAVRGYGDPRSGASPYVDWPCYDVVAQAFGGVVAMNGTAEGEPLKLGPFVGDMWPASLAALATTSALLHAQRTGEGQFVDVAMTDTMMALADFAMMRWSYMGRDTPPSGNATTGIVPFNLYETSDGLCAIGAPTNRQWARLCDAMDRPELVTDERMVDGRMRLRNKETVDEAVGEWARTNTTAGVVEALGGLVPVGPVNDASDLVGDPHVAAREMLVRIDHPGGRPTVQPNTPMHLSATPAGVYRRPPALDEHRAEILAELDAGDER